ncbi:MAG: HU family DNA-binding protein [Bacteroidales bacterium]|nr:HU family DNA-binding protein [Bacteroidales bacterium]
MDYKSFRTRLTALTGRQPADIDALTEALAMIIHDSAADLDSIAIPTFGTFVPLKHREEVRTDFSTGKRMLVPPEITLEFKPGAMLLKRLRNE